MFRQTEVVRRSMKRNSISRRSASGGKQETEFNFPLNFRDAFNKSGDYVTCDTICI